MVESIQANILINGLVAWSVNRMEQSKTPALTWISQNTPRISKSMMAIAAAMHAAGVAWTFSDGTLTITGLHLAILAQFFVSAGYNFILQHFIYKQVVVSRRRSGDPAPEPPVAAAAAAPAQA